MLEEEAARHKAEVCHWWVGVSACDVVSVSACDVVGVSACDVVGVSACECFLRALS